MPVMSRRSSMTAKNKEEIKNTEEKNNEISATVDRADSRV